MTHKKKWLLLAPAGLLGIGAGACLVGWAANLKNQGAPTTDWVLAGSAALAVLNASVSLFGQSVIERTLHEIRDVAQPPQPPATLPDLPDLPF